MNNLHIGLIILALVILGYVVYVNFVKKSDEQPQNEGVKTGRSMEPMPLPPQEEEVVQIYCDTPEDLMTYYTDPELEFGISNEEFESMVQKEMEKRRYQVKKLERTKYMNEEKAKKLNDLSRNHMEDIALKTMKKKQSVTESLYEGSDYINYRENNNAERGQGISTRHQMDSLHANNLDRHEALAY